MPLFRILHLEAVLTVLQLKRKTCLPNHALTRKSRAGSSPGMRKSISFTTTAPSFWTARWPKKRRAEVMTNFLRSDSENRRLIMDKTFAKNAQIVGSTEYDMTERSCCWMRPTALMARFFHCRRSSAFASVFMGIIFSLRNNIEGWSGSWQSIVCGSPAFRVRSRSSTRALPATPENL